MKTATKFLTITSVLAITLALGACSVGGGNTAPSKSTGGAGGDTTTVTVGMIPTASFAPIYVAQEKGYFADEGLKVDVKVVSNAASIVPSVLNGQMQFGTAATPPFLVAVSKGLPIEGVVNSAGTASSQDKDTGCIMVRSDSLVKDLKDLVGKNVATNQLGSLPHVAATAILTENGVDAKAVGFAPMPFPDMLGALKQDRVDALLIVEPFMTQGLKSGGVTCMSALYTRVYEPGTTDTLVLSSKDYIASHPKVVDGFANAIKKANKLVANDPQVLRDALVKYSHMDQEVANAVHLSEYTTSFDVKGMQKMADQMVSDGFLKTKIDVSSVLRRP